LDKIIYTQEKMDDVKIQIRKLLDIVRELENDFPGRPFTLDGHLVGSIGEVMAAYYYGIELYAASTPAHDGEIDGKKVQIKISQQNKIAIYHEPEYLIVLYLTKSGDIYEVYNGPGREPWNRAGKMDRHNICHMTVNQLMELDGCVSDENRIHPIHLIEKMKAEYKNKKKIRKD
jgi:hypothetical protein